VAFSGFLSNFRLASAFSRAPKQECLQQNKNPEGKENADWAGCELD
jgi:hypothetical protein